MQLYSLMLELIKASYEIYTVWSWSLNRPILNFIRAGIEEDTGNTEVYAGTEDFTGNTEVNANLHWSFHKDILNYIQSNNDFYTDWQVLQAETEMEIYN